MLMVLERRAWLEMLNLWVLYIVHVLSLFEGGRLLFWIDDVVYDVMMLLWRRRRGS